jgi:uncharacterized protein (TIGR02391 family)
MSILNELEKFQTDLSHYRELITYLRANTLTKTGRKNLDSLCLTIVPDAGRYKNLIIELTGMHIINIPLRDKEYDTDIWAVSFQIPPVQRTPIALSYCITAVGQAIGKLKDDIKNGLRDEKGKLININNGVKDSKKQVASGEVFPNTLFENLKFHSRLIEVSEPLFKTGNYDSAIFEAFKAVNNYVKEKTGSILDGTNLMEKVFNENKPILKVNELLNPSDKDEQNGFKHLFMGSQLGIRNPRSHESTKQEDPVIALQYLSIASLLMKRIDQAKLVKLNIQE